MANWTQRGEFIYPINLSEAQKDAIAQAVVDYAQLETFENERLMFDKTLPASADWGATETHRRIKTRLFSELADGLQSAIQDGKWYVLNDNGELLATNDPDKLDGETITHGLQWQAGVSVAIGELMEYNIQIYECIQTHTTQIDWTPDVAVSLWKKYLRPGEALEWRQPQGAHDAYPLGVRVIFNEQIYVSTIDNNVWPPDVTGWQLEGEQPTDEWQAGISYQIDDVVTYNSIEYICIQPHTAQIGWEPPNPGIINVLWQVA